MTGFHPTFRFPRTINLGTITLGTMNLGTINPDDCEF